MKDHKLIQSLFKQSFKISFNPATRALVGSVWLWMAAFALLLHWQAPHVTNSFHIWIFILILSRWPLSFPFWGLSWTFFRLWWGVLVGRSARLWIGRGQVCRWRNASICLTHYISRHFCWRTLSWDCTGHTDRHLVWIDRISRAQYFILFAVIRAAGLKFLCALFTGGCHFCSYLAVFVFKVLDPFFDLFQVLVGGQPEFCTLT